MNPILYKYFHKLLTPAEVQKCVDLRIPGFFIILGTVERQFLLRTLLGKHLQKQFSLTTLESITSPISSVQNYREERVYWIDSTPEDKLTLSKIKKISEISTILSPKFRITTDDVSPLKTYPKFILPYPERLLTSTTHSRLQSRFEVLSLQDHYEPSIEFLELIHIPA
jgi:hypothetical protein